jgi:hypothetical protein
VTQARRRVTSCDIQWVASMYAGSVWVLTASCQWYRHQLNISLLQLLTPTAHERTRRSSNTLQCRSPAVRPTSSRTSTPCFTKLHQVLNGTLPNSYLTFSSRAKSRDEVLPIRLTYDTRKAISGVTICFVRSIVAHPP